MKENQPEKIIPERRGPAIPLSVKKDKPQDCCCRPGVGVDSSPTAGEARTSTCCVTPATARGKEPEPEARPAAPSCCGGPDNAAASVCFTEVPLLGAITTPLGDVPVFSPRFGASERLGSWRVRWALGRDRYAVQPGLYAVGKPEPGAPVLVTCNYKFTVDLLRRDTQGLNAWVLVLDTRGINVWCAAGKGHFGTAELVRRLEAVRLGERVTGRTLVLPQLAATGVCAHEVLRRTGFRVIYGPVRIADLPAFLAAGMKATVAMRTVTFTFRERLAVIPVELVGTLKYLGILALVLAAWAAVFAPFPVESWAILFGTLAGTVGVGTTLAPALLPWIPFRSFALKGWLAGAVWAGTCAFVLKTGSLTTAGLLLLLPALSAFLTLNFTGSSTFTSQTGVNREIGLYARPIFLAVILGLPPLVAGFFIG